MGLPALGAVDGRDTERALAVVKQLLKQLQARIDDLEFKVDRVFRGGRPVDNFSGMKVYHQVDRPVNVPEEDAIWIFDDSSGHTIWLSNQRDGTTGAWEWKQFSRGDA